MAIIRSVPDLWRRDRWNPFREMSKMQRNMDRILSDVFAEPLSSDWGNEERVGFTPACDFEETDSHFLLSFDLPGISKNDVKIEVLENQVFVSGVRKEEKKEEKPTRYSSERYYGAFQRTFNLPGKINGDKVEANYQDGVLQIAIPKMEIAKGKLVQIEEKKGGIFERLLAHKESHNESKDTKKAA